MAKKQKKQDKVVFIADKLSDEALGVLDGVPGIAVDNRPGLPIEEKLEAVKGATVLIVRSATKADQQLLEAAKCLELVVRAGVGIDNIDLPVATRKGVVVQNVPEGNVRSAAEHAVALILALSRNIPQAHRSLKDGLWERSKFVGTEVQSKKLGVVGLGKIGRHVVRMASGLGFHILGFDPFIAPMVAEELGVELAADLNDLISKVDYLTIHVPKTEATLGLINADVLQHAQQGLKLINCARGGIVDEDALVEALNDGRVAVAAVDVFAKEPPPKDSPLVAHERVIVTPHLGASTREAQQNVAITAAQQVVDFLQHGKLHSPVNAVSLDPEIREKVEPYGRLAMRAGRLQAQLLQGNPSRVVVKYFGDIFDQETQNFVTSAVLEGFLKDRSAQPVNWINARPLAKEQGIAVEERSEGGSRYFVNLLRVEVTDSKGTREVGASIRGRRGMRLVSLDSYQFDAVLEGVLLIAANEDSPGKIAAITQVLAAHGINISYMTLGRDKSGGTAVALLNLDSPVGSDVVDDLSAKEGILWARVVDVG